MPHTYIYLDELKTTGGLQIAGTSGDAHLLALTEAVAEHIDRYTNRRFVPITGTRIFSGDGSIVLLVGDIVSVGTLAEDSNGDGTYDTAWASADFNTEPINAYPTSDYGRPYNKLVVNLRSNGTQDVFLAGQNNYRVTGTWGYSAVILDTGRDTSASLDSTATAVTLDGSATNAVQVGMTALLGSEYVYVTASTATSVTVIRGVRGSTATVHAADTDVQYFAPPAPVKEAALIQVGRLWTRRNSGFASEVGFPETGQMVVFRGLDPDVKIMLVPYRKIPMGA